MSDLKKTFIGGYKKSVVDETINELNKRLEKAEAGERQMSRKLESADFRIEELERKIAQLQLENENLKNSENDNQRIFNDIAKVYKRAYSAGYDIVCESKDTAVSMLQGISDRFDESMEDTETALAKYENIQAEINSALVSLNEIIGSVAKSTSMILDRAKTFSGIYGQAKDIMRSAVEDSENALKEYENYSSEFLAVQGISDGESHASSDGAAVPEAAEAPAAPAVDYAEPPVAADEPDTAENVSQANAAADIPEPKEPAPVAAAAPITAAAAAASAEEPQKIAEFPQTHSPSPRSGEFTQFGRRSKVSPEDRNELIRKALLKNSMD